MNRKFVIIGVCAIAAIAAFTILRTKPTQPVTAETSLSDKSIVAIEMPAIEGNNLIGQRIFKADCASCHGENAVGTEGKAPPLIHKIYEPSHHSDESFQRAIASGVKSHHWPFGDMPPIKGLTRGEVAMLVAYIREIQRANGIN